MKDKQKNTKFDEDSGKCPNQNDAVRYIFSCQKIIPYWGLNKYNSPQNSVPYCNFVKGQEDQSISLESKIKRAAYLLTGIVIEK